jgi:hypothetical protein
MKKIVCDSLFWSHDAGMQTLFVCCYIWAVIAYCDFWAGTFVLINGLCIEQKFTLNG